MSGWRILNLLMWVFVAPLAFVMFIISPLFYKGWIIVWLAACGVVIAAAIVSKWLSRLAGDAEYDD